jgi:hypothetical protein
VAIIFTSPLWRTPAQRSAQRLSRASFRDETCACACGVAMLQARALRPEQMAITLGAFVDVLTKTPADGRRRSSRSPDG